MKKTKFYKIKYSYHETFKCKYEGNKTKNSNEYEIIEETTRLKAIKYLKSKYDTYNKKDKDRDVTIFINQVIEL